MIEPFLRRLVWALPQLASSRNADVGCRRATIAAAREQSKYDVGCRHATIAATREQSKWRRLVPPRNHGALAAAIEKLALDAPLRARLGAAGRDIVVKEYAESIVVRETLDLYRHLCSAGAAS